MSAPPHEIFWLKYCLLTTAACQGTSPNLTSSPPTILDFREYTFPHSVNTFRCVFACRNALLFPLLLFRGKRSTRSTRSSRGGPKCCVWAWIYREERERERKKREKRTSDLDDTDLQVKMLMMIVMSICFNHFVTRATRGAMREKKSEEIVWVWCKQWKTCTQIERPKSDFDNTFPPACISPSSHPMTHFVDISNQKACEEMHLWDLLQENKWRKEKIQATVEIHYATCKSTSVSRFGILFHFNICWPNAGDTCPFNGCLNCISPPGVFSDLFSSKKGTFFTQQLCALFLLSFFSVHPSSFNLNPENSELTDLRSLFFSLKKNALTVDPHSTHTHVTSHSLTIHPS